MRDEIIKDHGVLFIRAAALLSTLREWRDDAAEDVMMADTREERDRMEAREAELEHVVTLAESLLLEGGK